MSTVIETRKSTRTNRKKQRSPRYAAKSQKVILFQCPDNGLKTSRKPKCLQRLVLKSFSRGARPKCLHASLGRNLKIHLLFSPLSGRRKRYRRARACGRGGHRPRQAV